MPLSGHHPPPARPSGWTVNYARNSFETILNDHCSFVCMVTVVKFLITPLPYTSRCSIMRLVAIT